MNKDQISILIDKKASGLISISEEALLNRMSKHDPALSSEIRLQTDIYKGIEYAADHELRNMLKDIHKQEYSSMSKSGQIINLRWLASIAAILVTGIITFSSGLLSTLDKPNEDVLYAANYSPYKASFQSRGSGVEATAKYQAYYDVGNYKKAVSVISPFLDNDNPEILLTVGICYMELSEWEKAESFFDNVILSKNIFYINHARWYKSLSLIQQKEIPNAIKELEMLTANIKADHYKEAYELLHSIK